MGKVFKRLEGKSLLVIIDQEEVKEDKLKRTEGGIIIPDEAKSITKQFTLATIVQTGEEVPKEYSPGGRIMLPPVTGHKELKYKDFDGQLIQFGSVIGLI